MAGGKGGGKNAKSKKFEGGSTRAHYTMRVVDSATCAVCKTPCERGLRYLARMAEPGAVGQGVPCILTRRRVN